MTDDIREALNNAWSTLTTCTEQDRPAIRRWIDALLDQVNRSSR